MHAASGNDRAALDVVGTKGGPGGDTLAVRAGQWPDVRLPAALASGVGEE